jgi:hypothetical protein
MNSTLLDLILRQSYLHLLSYGLVLAILLAAFADAYLVSHLRRALRSNRDQLRHRHFAEDELGRMVHPAAQVIRKLDRDVSPATPSTWQRQVDLAEAALFVPLRARMALTRDLSTLMGLIATLLALVAAASDFARHGKPELLIGSVGTGCMATCVAAIGCAIALWNLSRLSRLRLAAICDSEELLCERRAVTEAGPVESEVPIRHVSPSNGRLRNPQREEEHASF